MTRPSHTARAWGRLASVLLLLVLLIQQGSSVAATVDQWLHGQSCAAGEDCHPEGDRHPGECDSSCNCEGCPSHSWLGLPLVPGHSLTHPLSVRMNWAEPANCHVPGATRPPFRPPSA